MVDRLTQQIEDIEEWRLQQIRLTRKVLMWLAFALTFLVLGGIWSLWQIDNLVEANTRAIERQRQIDLALAQDQFLASDTRWEACTKRNEIQSQQLRQDKVQLTKVIKAHLKDGNTNVARAWADYLKAGQAVKPVDCGPKPTPPNAEPLLPSAPRNTTGG